MLLATYQPAGSNPKMYGLTDILGYCPRFCFSAENLEQFFTLSVLLNACRSETITIFDTDDYDMLDCVKWNQYLSAECCEKKEGLWTALNCNYKEKYSVFLVKDVTNTVINIPVTSLLNKGTFHISENQKRAECLNAMICHAQKICAAYLKKMQVVSTHPLTEQQVNDIRMSTQRKVIQYFVLPYVYQFGVTQNGVCSESMYFNDQGLFKYHISENGWIEREKRIEALKKKFYNSHHTLAEKTYLNFDKMYYEISSLIKESEK